MKLLRKDRSSDKNAVLVALREKIKTVIGEEPPVFNTRFDLDGENRRVYGILALTDTQIVTAVCDGACKHAPSDDAITLRVLPIDSMFNVAYTKQYGCLSVEYEDENGTLCELCRSTLKYQDYLMDAVDYIGDLREKKPINRNDKKKTRVCPKCGRPYRRGSSTCLYCGGVKMILRHLYDTARPYLPTLFVSVLLFFVTSGLGLLAPYINKILIDDYIKAPRPEGITLSSFLLVVGALAGTDLLERIIGIFRSILLLRVSSKMIVGIRTELFGKVQQMSIGRISEHTTGDLITRISSDTNALNDFLTYRLPEIFQNVLMLIAVLIIMIIRDPLLTALIVLPCPVVIGLFSLVNKLMRRIYRKQWFAGSQANTVMHDIFQGIRVVKVFGMEAHEEKKFDDIVARERDIRAKNETIWAVLIPSMNFLMGIGEFIVLYYVGRRILKLEMTLGELSLMTSYMNMVYGKLRFLSRLPRTLISTGTSISKIYEIIDEESDVADKENALDVNIEGNVEFRDVSFGYLSHEEVLHDISFSAKKGEMIGIVGHSGSGKSTLINLLMRLYDAESGDILIDGVNIRDIAQDSLRRQMGVVLQETFLFTGTVYDNIAYAKPEAPRDEIIRAAKLAGAHNFIIKLPDAYNTVVGERGYTLSGGERQRIAIARAILSNPKILILDEATSALDTQTEKQIQDALAHLIQNRTTFAIAHRLSTLRNATRLIVLDGGKVAEIGTHDELIRKKGIYYELVMAQRQMSKM